MSNLTKKNRLFLRKDINRMDGDLVLPTWMLDLDHLE